VHADIGDDAAGRDDLLAELKLAGTPTASMAVSTPRSPVSFMTPPALPFVLLMVAVAPKRLAASRRLSSRSIMMISAGE